MSNTAYKGLSIALIATWFVLVLSASALHIFQNAPGQPPLALGLAVLIPLAGFFLWFSISRGFRNFVLALNARTLTLIHSWRLVGFTFLVLYSAGLLPGSFALSAGWGDIAIGATAPLAALWLATPKHRTAFILWQILGMLDLISAVSLGTLSSLLAPAGVSTAIMAALPMSLIPTFAVPLLLILHVLCIAQALGWRESSPTPLSSLSSVSA